MEAAKGQLEPDSLAVPADANARRPEKVFGKIYYSLYWNTRKRIGRKHWRRLWKPHLKVNKIEGGACRIMLRAGFL
jgi:hypothetical protein